MYLDSDNKALKDEIELLKLLEQAGSSAKAVALFAQRRFIIALNWAFCSP